MIPYNIQMQYKITNKIEVIEKVVNPIELLCPNRLDIAAKVRYLKLRDKIPTYAEEAMKIKLRDLKK